MERTFTNEARRAQIMRAAIDTIAELGYAKASFARITEKAGLSGPRMISYHFADKDDLIHEILMYVLTAGARFINERVEAADTPVGKLRAYLEANLQFLREHPNDVAALTEIGPHLRTAADRPYTSVSAQEVSAQSLEKLLAQGQTSGEFRDFDVRSMAVLIRGAVDGAARRLRDEADFDFDFDAYVREAVTTFTRAVAR
ncbi:TetR/AcrR family transcriptional regulator [Amycolatopsis balhimycina DSM 5908]|uniref:TetR/AcrR family transcriptional regulator n=1 Tax=Amycolatopsis balhimycina DSM 5908 TaxID=1081091 RepID=A0A428WTH1_AMYBA|nr:TetR/AcrR family transcriptional regulator [Amycolatopsis balhimycina]RSM46384.1 TetR/AcrR family transcriptional regulator [Amycolatopsis balhimycina DSM 5908]